MLWAAFLGSFVAIALWETIAPARLLRFSTARRWGLSGFLAFSNSLVSWVIHRGAAMLVAVFSFRESTGLLSHPSLPFWLSLALALPLLDFVRYAQHRAFHSIPFLWRWHRVHHADPDYDLTTALRFHPGETLFTEGTYLLAVALLGPPPLVVLTVDILVLGQNFFTHANASLPATWRTWLDWVWITPDLHRHHHGIEIASQHTNFGTIFPWWDRVAGTFEHKPLAEGFAVGLDEIDPADALRLSTTLLLPFQPLTDNSTIVRSSSTSSASSTPSDTTVKTSPAPIGNAAS